MYLEPNCITKVICILASYTRKMKPAHLQLVTKIAEVEKLQVAADALGMSQPAASRILSMIETEVDGALFIRHPWGMEPTELGQAFLRHARVIQSEYDTLENELHAINVGASGAVRVGCVTGPAVDCLVPAVQVVRSQTPGLNVKIEIGPSTQLVRGLEEGIFDFIIARISPDLDAAAFQMHPARRETVALVVHQSHRLANEKSVGLGDLSQEEWIMQERGSPIREAVEHAYYSQGIAIPLNVTDSSSLLVALAMIASGNAVAPLTEQVADLFADDRLGAKLAKLSINERIQVRPFFVIRNRYKQQTPATQRVLEETLRRL